MYLLALILYQYHRAQEDETLALVEEMLSKPYGFLASTGQVLSQSKEKPAYSLSSLRYQLWGPCLSVARRWFHLMYFLKQLHSPLRYCKESVATSIASKLVSATTDSGTIWPEFEMLMTLSWGLVSWHAGMSRYGHCKHSHLPSRCC